MKVGQGIEVNIPDDLGMEQALKGAGENAWLMEDGLEKMVVRGLMRIHEPPGMGGKGSTVSSATPIIR